MRKTRDKLTKFDQELQTGSLPLPADACEADSLQVGQCAFCMRILKSGTTEHHLIPRRCHTNRWFQKRFSRLQMRETVASCADCHRAIHRFVPCEKDLGRSFNTIPLLLAHPGFARFVAWVCRQK